MAVLRIKIDLLKKVCVHVHFSFKMKVYVDAQNMCFIHLFTNMSHRHLNQAFKPIENRD